ncbi:DUF6053 domain-containing protein [Lysobacter enzymogenes]|uniref:DUF6053 domain-containing protein n=1 Tax=Lysobacter enzymogenes TaxID=69 RepID=UPI0037481997
MEAGARAGPVPAAPCSCRCGRHFAFAVVGGTSVPMPFAQVAAIRPKSIGTQVPPATAPYRRKPAKHFQNRRAVAPARRGR